MENQPPTSPRLAPWLAGLVTVQMAMAGLLYGLSSLLNRGTTSGGITAVGHFLGAQTLGSLLETKHPGKARPLRHLLSLCAMTFQVALGLVYYLAFGLPDLGPSVDPKKMGMLAFIVIPVTSGLSYGFTWLGLTSGIRVMEKQRARMKK